jgi:hypothetical protein
MAGDICKEALALQGLPVPNSIATNTNDATSRQVWAQLRNQGRRFCKPVKTHRWQVLTRTWNLTTVPGQTLYLLPPDHDSFNDITAWNRTAAMPLSGPATGPQWACLKARSAGAATISVAYRTVENKFQLASDYSSPQQLAIEYTSRGWVRQVNSSYDNPIYADAPTEDGDMVLFDPEMMVAAVQYGFMSAKGFDTTAISALLDKLIEAAIDTDSDAPVLQVVNTDAIPLLGVQNVPDSGYGL